MNSINGAFLKDIWYRQKKKSAAKGIRVLALCLMILWTGCSRPAVRPTEHPPVRSQLPPEQAQLKPSEEEAPPEEPAFELTSRPNPAYNNPRESVSLTDDEAYFMGVLESSCRQKGWPSLDFDPQLTVAARELSRYYALYQKAPPDRLIRFSMLWAGVGEVNPVFFFYSVMEEVDLEKFDGFVREWLKEVQKRKRFNTAGIGIYRLQTDHPNEAISYISIMGIDRRIDLAPIPKTIPSENRFIVQGSCRNAPCNLKFYLEFLGEYILDAPIKTSNGRFSFEVQVPSAPAVYHLEIVKVQAKGHKILTSFPIYNKIPLSRRFKLEEDRESCKTQDCCEVLLHESINNSRAAVQTSRLIVSESLTKTARAHAEDMLKKHYSSTYDLKGRDAGERMKNYGVTALQAGEVVDGAYSMAAVQEHFHESPSLNDFLQNPTLTHMGCGVMLRENPNGPTYYAASCIVATLIDSRDERTLARLIFERINESRIKAGRPGLKKEPKLQKLADRAIRALLKHPDHMEDIQEKVNINIETSGLVRDRSIFGVFTLYNLSQLETNSSVQQLVDAHIETLVLGLRKVTDPRKPKRGIFVYYIAYK